MRLRRPTPGATVADRVAGSPPPAWAGPVIGLQRAVGNAAVAQLLGSEPSPKRTRHALVEATETETPDGLHVRQVTAGTPHGAARVLGLTSSPSRSQLRLPEVRTVPAPGGVTLVAGEAADTEDFESVSVAPGEVLRKADVPVYVGARVAAVQDPDFPPGEIALRSDHGPGRIERMTVALTVDGDTARLIRENEQQHPDDFAHAFEISARAVATAVQGLTGTVFKTDEQAFRALVARLPPALVPEWVLEPSAWSQHLWRVLDALYDLSKDRDRRNHHTPTGRVGTLGGTPQLLTMSPLMTPPRDGTESWITLAKLGLPRPDPRFELPVLPWTVGEGLVLRHDHVAALLDASLTSEDLETVVVAGSYGSFVGRVIRDGRLLLRIDLDPAGDRTLLLDPTDADLLAPGQRPDTHGDESRATPEPSAPLRAGGSASLRRGVADHLAFYTERAVAQGLEPGDDWESGPATAFTDRALSLLERTCLEGTDAWLVSMQGDYETLYAVIAASLLRGAT